MEKKKFYRSTPKNKTQDFIGKSDYRNRRDDSSEQINNSGEHQNTKRDTFKSDDRRDNFRRDNRQDNFRRDDRRDNFRRDERNDFTPRRNFEDRKVERTREFQEEKPAVNVRYYVYKCLCNIYIKHAYVNIDIDHMIRENDLSDLDRKLFTKIVYGTLQNERLLAWEMNQLSEKKPKDEARVIILMSLYQLRFLDKVPQFAVINEAVEIAKNEQGEFLGKFVNAVLREATRQNLQPALELFKDEYDYLSTIYNTPIFIIKMWERHYGKEQTLEILKSNVLEAPLSCRVNTSKASKEKILTNPDFISGTLANNSVIYVGSTPIAQTEEMKNGEVSVQDESSQRVVEFLAPQENDHILDMCAAPGSKTQYIANLMNNTGKILALDIHEHRVNIMKTYLNTLGITNTTCICFDSTKLHEKARLIESFDKVLLDAPCSGLGVIRRKPDILLDLNPDKLDDLVFIQEKLLDEAYAMLKPTGTLVYSTCTMNKKENNAQITMFLAKHKDMKLVEDKQIFPNEYNSDGFYIAKLIKE